MWLAVPSILLISIANTLMKWRMDKISNDLSVTKKISLIFTDPVIFIAVIATGMSVVWWLSIINRVKVSIVYPVIQAGVIASTAFLSLVFLGERLSSTQCLGLVVLSIGIFMLSTTTR